MSKPTVELLTLSYSGDFEVCRLLCQSIDRFVPADITHRLIVPRADLALFAPLASRTRKLEAQDHYLPAWFKRVPMPSPKWRKRLHLPRRDVYVTPFSLPVRGWIAQQIMKISAAAKSPADLVVHVDSDNVFVRPFSLERIYRDGHARIYRDETPVGLETHARWQRMAGKLLGLEAETFYGGEYIDPFVVWKTDVVRGLTERLEAVSGSHWIKTLARTQHFAEYVLYGVFADRIEGFEAAGLRPENISLCHSVWHRGFEDDDTLIAFVEALQPYHQTCLIQSTVAEDLASRERLFALVTKFAETQTAAATGHAH